MQKQSGFTLVELVVVIIILGILAVTAAPKFINMQGDARVSTLQGVKGAINGANVMVYAKASMNGLKDATDASASVAVGTGTVNTYNGYIAATPKAILAALNLNADEKGTTAGKDWVVSEITKPVAPTTGKNPTAGTPGKVKIQQVNAPEKCYIEYTGAPVNELPTISALPKASAC